ncbi:MAG TPA: FAD-binding oxidoreductase [Anaerolineales bacterium]|nr:FAD-binding oxidoreductase [Anaerolineales bacterium]
MEKVLSEKALDELQRSLAGTVIRPTDAGYDAARHGFNALIDRRPAVIARCVSAGDVAVAFDFARAYELEVAVRGGGHNPAGHCVCDGGLVIDLSSMRMVEVDADARTARTQGGATWLDFDTATQAYGLVTPGGVVVSTGVVGLSLGGGIGHLTAQYGLTCDHIIRAEVVTPDGTVIQVSADENADLLWGLRGGGGNFGVVTRAEYSLHPLEQVVGGHFVYSGEGVREALLRYRDVMTRSPRDLSCQVALGTNEALVPILEIIPCYTGQDTDPEELQVLRSAPGLSEDTVRVQTFLAQQAVVSSTYGANRHYWKGHFVRELPDELLDEMLKYLVALGRPPGGLMIESLHGASKDADVPPGAVGFRQAAFNVSALAVWQDPALDAEQIDWARQAAAAAEPWSFSGGGYVNYMQADEPIERVRAAFGAETFDRLQRLKQRYDPHNILHRNQNIPPL